MYLVWVVLWNLMPIIESKSILNFQEKHNISQKLTSIWKIKLERAKFIFFVIIGAYAIPAIITSTISGSGFLIELTIHFANSIANTFDVTAFQFLINADTFLIIIAVTWSERELLNQTNEAFSFSKLDLRLDSIQNKTQYLWVSLIWNILLNGLCNFACN